jgi:hypothetical protein
MSTLAEFGLFGDTALELVRSTLCRAVDEQAAAVRGHYITPGAGQAMVYAAKAAEASAALADPEPLTPGRYPLLVASVGIDGADIREVAGAVLAAATISTRVLQLVEETRLGTKRRITAATTAEGALAAYDAAKWLEGL